MEANKDTVKARIEAEYDQTERTVDAGTDHVGQMTIAFCGDCITDNTECPDLELE